MAQEEERVKIIFDTNAAKAAGDVNKLGTSIDGATNATDKNNDSVEQGNAAYKTFKAQLREANQELQKQIQLTGESSEETIKAAKAVAELKDQMGFAADLTDSFNPDQKMKALGAATQVAATGVQGVTAGMALFGDQSEDTQKALLKVQAAMAFSDAIGGLSNLGDQFKILQTVVKDTFAKIVAAKAAEKAATDAGTASQLRQNLAVLANPYVIAAAAVAALSIGVYAWAKANGEAAKREEEVTKSVAKNSLATKDLARSIEEAKSSTQSSNEIEILRARAYGKTDAEIQKLIKSQKDLGVQQAAQMRMDAFNNYARAEADYYKALKTDNEDVIKSAKENLNESFEIFKSAQQEKREAEREQVKFSLETKISENEKLKQIEEKRTAKQKEEAQKRKDIAKEEADALKKKQEDLFNEGQEFFKNAQEVQKTNDQADADLKKEQLDRLNAIDIEGLDFETQKAIKQSEIDKKNLDNKIAVDAALKNLGNQGVAAAKDLFAKNKNIQKGIVIAESGVALGKLAVNTVEAVGKDNAASPLTFGMPWSGIHIGQGVLGAASIIASTNKQLQALGGGSAPSSGAGGISGMSGARSATPPTVAFNNSAENQIGQSVARVQTEQPPLKVFVAESDISKAQNNVKVLENKNSF